MARISQPASLLLRTLTLLFVAHAAAAQDAQAAVVEASSSTQDVAAAESPVDVTAEGEQSAPTANSAPAATQPRLQEPDRDAAGYERVAMVEEAPTAAPIEEAPQDTPTVAPIEESPLSPEASMAQEAPTEAPTEEALVAEETPTVAPIEEALAAEESPTVEREQETLAVSSKQRSDSKENVGTIAEEAPVAAFEKGAKKEEVVPSTATSQRTAKAEDFEATARRLYEESPQAAQVRKLTDDGNSQSLLETLLTTIEAAQKVGLSASELAPAEAKAKAMAHTALREAMVAPKTVECAWVLKQAFLHAERAKVEASDRDAAWTTLQTEAQALLASTVEAASKSQTLPTTHALADALFIVRKLGLVQDTGAVSSARELFEKQLRDAFEHSNFDLTALAVRLADEAGAHYDQRVQRWVELSQQLRQVASQLEDQTVPALLGTLKPAREFPLPRTQELVSLEAVAKNKTEAELKMALVSAANITNPMALVGKWENAKGAGVNSSAVLQAERTAQALAIAELKSVLGGKKDMQSLGTIKDAFHCARHTGVPQSERDAVWSVLQLELQWKLGNDTEAANRTRSLQTLQELADSIFLWRKLSFPDVAPHVLTNAQQVYSRQVEIAFTENDLNYTILGARLSSQAGTRCSAGARRWVDVFDKLVQVAADILQQPLQVLVNVIQQCHDSALPRTSFIASVEAQALSIAMAQFNEEFHKSHDVNLDKALVALENVRAANPKGNSTELAAAIKKVESAGLARLKSALEMPKTVGNLPLIKEAFQFAARAGVSNGEQESSRAALQAQIDVRLINVTKAANATRTTQTIQDLADAIFLWRKMQFPEGDTLTRAKMVYGQQLDAGIAAQEIGYSVLAVSLASQASVKCSESSRRWADIAGRVQQAAAKIEDQSSSALLALVNEARDASHPPTAELLLLQATAQVEVRAALAGLVPPTGSSPPL